MTIANNCTTTSGTDQANARRTVEQQARARGQAGSAAANGDTGTASAANVGAAHVTECRGRAAAKTVGNPAVTASQQAPAMPASTGVVDGAVHAAKGLYEGVTSLSDETKNRIIGAAKTVGGTLEGVVAAGLALTPEPTGLTKVAAVAVGLHAADTLQSGIRQTITGQSTASVTQASATGVAKLAGASDATATNIGVGVDVAAGLAGGLAGGAAALLRRGATAALETGTETATRAGGAVGRGGTTVARTTAADAADAASTPASASTNAADARALRPYLSADKQQDLDRALAGESEALAKREAADKAYRLRTGEEGGGWGVSKLRESDAYSAAAAAHRDAARKLLDEAATAERAANATTNSAADARELRRFLPPDKQRALDGHINAESAARARGAAAQKAYLSRTGEEGRAWEGQKVAQIQAESDAVFKSQQAAQGLLNEASLVAERARLATR